MKRKKRGYFIVLEGGEGSGKTSLLKRIANEYGDKIVVSREPGGSKFAEKIRELILSQEAKDADAKTMFFLFCAARASHMQEKIKKALRAGKVLISDRFDASTYAYQIIGQEEKELKSIYWDARKLILDKDKYAPNLYVYLDVNPEIGLIRRDKDKGQQNHFDRRDIKFHQTLQKGFKEFFANKNQPVKKLIINAENSQEQVFQDLKKVLDKLV